MRVLACVRARAQAAGPGAGGGGRAHRRRRGLGDQGERRCVHARARPTLVCPRPRVCARLQTPGSAGRQCGPARSGRVGLFSLGWGVEALGGFRPGRGSLSESSFPRLGAAVRPSCGAPPSLLPSLVEHLSESYASIACPGKGRLGNGDSERTTRKGRLGKDDSEVADLRLGAKGPGAGCRELAPKSLRQRPQYGPPATGACKGCLQWVPAIGACNKGLQ